MGCSGSGVGMFVGLRAVRARWSGFLIVCHRATSMFIGTSRGAAGSRRGRVRTWLSRSSLLATACWIAQRCGQGTFPAAIQADCATQKQPCVPDLIAAKGTDLIAIDPKTHMPSAHSARYSISCSSLRAGRDLALIAGAGTGKTSTLQLMGESTTKKGLYIAFNRSIADEASTRFKANVRCRTAHSLARAAV